jgi:hypothetical protein
MPADSTPMSIPMLRESDYPEFRRMLPELPSTYAAWLARKASIVATSRAPGGIADVDITPEDFRRYLLEGDKRASAWELWNCARNMAKPSQEPDDWWEPLERHW